MASRWLWRWCIGLSWAGVAVALAACAADPDSAMRPVRAEGATLAWSHDDDPNRILGFRTPHLADLPLSGAAAVAPWPGSHWPIAQDAINYRWDGPHSLSPVEKYQRAEGGTHLEDAVSAEIGIDNPQRQRCDDDAACSPAEICAKRRGQTSGACVEPWWGMCDAWATAAVLHPQPRGPVWYRGVHFKVNDIKALLTYAYRRAQVAPLSHPWNSPVTDGPRGTNAATFHLALTHALGLYQRAWTEDRDLSEKVFMHPVQSFAVQDIRSVSKNEAMALFDSEFSATREVAEWMYVKTAVRYVDDVPSEWDGPLDLPPKEDTYEYLLELDPQGDIVGGEWLGASRVQHPDFLWQPVQLSTDATRVLSTEVILRLAERSQGAAIH